MYNIAIVDSAKKELAQLSVDDKKRTLSVLERIMVDPYHYVLRLSGSKSYRLRAGKIRVILDIDELSRTITVLRIGNRETVYSQR